MEFHLHTFGMAGGLVAYRSIDLGPLYLISTRGVGTQIALARYECDCARDEKIALM